MSNPITIIGAGRFGSYFNRLLNDAGEDSITIDLDPRQSEMARLAESKTVFMAVPIRSFEGALKTFAPAIGDGTTVMDVCSVKVWPAHLLNEAFRGRKVTAIATHPLFGPQSAPGSACGQRISAWPLMGATVDGVASAMDIFHRLKLNVLQFDPHEHDQQVARSQALNHFLGRGAAAYGLTEVAMSTKTHVLFLDIMKIITGNTPELFEDMNVFNPYAGPARQEFIDALIDLHRKLRILEIESPAARRVQALALP
jgi:prephenate dehydrogenase